MPLSISLLAFRREQCNSAQSPAFSPPPGQAHSSDPHSGRWFTPFTSRLRPYSEYFQGRQFHSEQFPQLTPVQWDRATFLNQVGDPYVRKFEWQQQWRFVLHRRGFSRCDGGHGLSLFRRPYVRVEHQSRYDDLGTDNGNDDDLDADIDNNDHNSGAESGNNDDDPLRRERSLSPGSRRLASNHGGC